MIPTLETARRTVTTSIATAADGGAWEAYVDARGDAAGYHSWRWRRVFSEAFGHEPVYLAARQGGVITGVGLGRPCRGPAPHLPGAAEEE